MLFKLASITLALTTARSATAANPNSVATNTGTENRIVPDQRCIDFCTDYFSLCSSSNSFINPTKSESNDKKNSRKRKGGRKGGMKNLRKLVLFSEADQPRTNAMITAAVEDCQQTCMTWPRADPNAYTFITAEPADTFNSNLGGDTLACRERHLSFAAGDLNNNHDIFPQDASAFHCPHATNPSTGICRDSQVNGYGPYELLRDGQATRHRIGYCDLAAHDTIADCTDINLSTDDGSFVQALKELPDTVEVLFANGNPGIKTLGEDIFDGLPNLQAIYLNDCGIETIASGVLSELSNLKVFVINMNPIAAIPSDLFNNTPGLLQFEYFTTFQGNATLFTNSGLPAGLFEKTLDIERIIIYGHKRLTALPEGLLKGLTKLNIFSVVDNGLTSGGIPDNLFHDCTSLQFWDFFGNSMDTFDDRWFFEGGGWEKNILRVAMWGQCNGLNTVDTKAFAGMDSLETAYFHNNDLLDKGVYIDPEYFEDKENFHTLTSRGGLVGSPPFTCPY